MYCSHQYLSNGPKKVWHAHFNAHKLPKTVSPTVFMLKTFITEMYLFCQYLSIDPKKSLPRPLRLSLSTAHITIYIEIAGRWRIRI